MILTVVDLLLDMLPKQTKAVSHVSSWAFCKSSDVDDEMPADAPSKHLIGQIKPW